MYHKPNVRYTCEVCGALVEKYLEPSRQRMWPPRFCNRTCAGKWRKGSNHPRWTGGREVDSGGYVYIRCSDHPHKNRRGYIFEHRLVMEQALGRYLDPQEVVHHKNDNPADNRIENLELFATNADHKRYHDQYRIRTTEGRWRKCNHSS